MKVFMVLVILVNIGGVLIFWKRNQNILYSILIFSCIFLFGATVYHDHNMDWRRYQKEYYVQVAKKIEDPAKKKKILNTPLEIKQIWTEGLDVADRCTSCHMGYNNPDMKDADTVFKYHEAAREHDFNDIGCTICHQGQGLATDMKHAHADHLKHWFKPLLPLNMSEAACSKCHKEDFLKGGETASKGKDLFVKMGCHGCHKMKGYDDLHKVATSLKGAAHKLEPSWLIKWMKNPQGYLANTRMPNFRISDDDALSMAAYVLSQTDDSYKPITSFKKGDPTKGEELFKTVGCLGCHAISGEGSNWASDLGKLSSKVKADWLVNWILEPKLYDHLTLMPKFRLTVEEARDITTYLLLIGPKPSTFAYEKEIRNPKRIENGKKLVQVRGCAGCHRINGIADSRVGPDLTKIGAKDEHFLDFGKSDVEHNLLAWIRNKLKNPVIYDTDNIKALMPSFTLSKEDIQALTVFLKGQEGTIVPSSYVKNLNPNEFEIEEGSKVVYKYNCRGCHVIGNKGGEIKQFYDEENDAPPHLETETMHVGDRIKDSWLFSFMRGPTPVREWLQVRMPTFNLGQNEIYYLDRFFGNQGEDKVIDHEPVKEVIPDDYLKEGRKLVLAFACLDCHDQGLAPPFSVVSQRVREKWAKRWMKNTSTMFPGTLMPDHWPVNESGAHVISSEDYPMAAKIMGGDADKQIDAIWAYISNYNERPFLNVQLPEG